MNQHPDHNNDLLAAARGRGELFNRLLRAVGGWADEDIAWLIDAIDSGAVVPEAASGDGECAGEGTCHGPAVWCDTCGDVQGVCDATSCSVHRCINCDVVTANRIDGQPWCEDCASTIETIGDDS